MQTIIVSTFVRGGSSLVMQMLDAGGHPCEGSAPAYEPRSIAIGAPLSRLAASGKAFKVMEPLAHKTCGTIASHAIWMDRDPHQRATSAIKFMKWQRAPVPTGRRAHRALKSSYMRELMPSLFKLQTMAYNVHRIDFESLINQPRRTARKLCEITGIDPAKADDMAAIVIDRHPDCLPYMLEEKLGVL